VDLIGVKAWVYWAAWLLRGCGEGMIYLSYGLLWWGLRVCSILYPLLSFLCVWAIPGDVPFVLSIKETILPSLFLVLVLDPFLPLTISLAFVLLLRCIVWACLWHLLPLLATPLLLYIEDLMI
jgi:hypothetical protein